MGYTNLQFTYNLTYSLSVYGVYSKQQPGYQCWPHCTEDHSTQLHIQVAHCTVQEYVHQMVPHGLQLVQQVVQSERGHTQRPVRLVAGWTIHGSPPKVMPQKTRPRGVGPKILVLFDSRLIIIDYSTLQSVTVH